MNLKLSFLALIAFVAGCSSSTIVEPPPPCSSALPSAALTVACTPPATINPVGSWSGTLTTTEGGSGTQTFTAEIRAVAGSSTDYTGVFTVAETVYNVTGFYTGTNDEGEAYTFQIPQSELEPAVSPVEFYGMMWSGQLTETSYSGGWFLNSEEAGRTPAGTFTLARQP